MTQAPARLDKPTARVVADLVPAGATVRSPADVRALIERVRVHNGPGPDMHAVTNYQVSRQSGHIPVRVLWPIPEPRGLAVLVPFGGWVAGTPGSTDTVARKLAERTSCAVALVDFRLAPEHPAGAAEEDLAQVFRWLRRTPPCAGPTFLVAEGMGAAPTLAALSRDNDCPPFSLQILISPMTSYDDPVTDGTGIVTGSLIEQCRNWAAISAPRPGSWRGLPPAIVVSAEHDPLRRAVERYVQDLRVHGVPVAVRHYEGQVHGLLGVLPLPLGERVMQHIVRVIRGYCSRFGVTAPDLPTDALSSWLDRTIR